MKIEKIHHRGEDRIRVTFPFDQDRTNTLKKIKGARYTAPYKGWHFPPDKAVPAALLKEFPDCDCDGLFEKEKTNNNKPDRYRENKDGKKNVAIERLDRKLIVRLPKNRADIEFLLSIRYSRWNKGAFCWEVPNYPGNMDRLTDYCKEGLIYRIEIIGL